MKTSQRWIVLFALWLGTLAAHAATITVISIADSGPGSLRQAIAVANNGDSIIFDPILTTKKIALTSGELVITKNITITGLGAANFAITGTTTSRVFTVTGGATATLTALTISGGTATNGGGIANFATLTLNNLTLSNNTATSGGAIYTSNGVLNVNNSALYANSATDGGAIFVVQGTATIAGSALATNSAANTGGAIANHGTVTLTNATLTGNNATFGGAIYNDAGNTLSLTISNSVTGNGASGGGGIFNEGTLSVGNSLIATNSALDGGGLYNNRSLTLNGATIAGNGADRGAGLFSTNGTVTVTNATFAGNTATTGGAVFNDRNNSLSFHTATLTGNSATTGGGLANFGTAMIDSSTLLSNSATTGGGIYSSNATAVVSGSLLSGNTGGIYNDLGNSLTVVISTLAGNGAALQNSGTLTLAESTLAGNASGLNNAGAATVDNTIFANNTGGNLAGAVISKGFNLSDDATGIASLTAAGDQNNTPAGLDPLGLKNNGGPTKTIALAAGSAAIAAGGPVYAPFEPIAGGGLPVYPPYTDQRGLARFVCGQMDIGAFQTQSTTPPAIELIGATVLTNECQTAFVDLGAAAANTCGNALAVAAGGTHSLALQQDGTVVGWGNNANGQTTVPGTLTDPVAIAAGGTHSLGLREDGTVIAWGNNANGQTSVPGNATNVTGISAGGFHSLAVDETGSVIGWGDNFYGQTNVPVSVVDAVAVAAGQYHSLALLGNGTVVGWGGGTFTAIPEDGVNYSQANVPAGLSNIVAIAAGAYHSLGLRADGVVFAWGAGLSNQFPFVDFGQSLVPANLSNVVAIAAGGFHSLALVDDGTVVAWGNDTYGQASVPAVLHRAAAIAGGTYHSLAISTGGAVEGWGLNTNGQCVAPSQLLSYDLTGQITIKTNGVLSQTGSATFTYSVADSRGLSNSIARTVITLDSTPPAPNSATLPSITNSCSVTLAKPTATDICAGTIIGSTTDATNYTALGTYTVHWRYTDLSGNSVTQLQTVVIVPPAPPVPTVNPLPSFTNACSVTLAKPTATDLCAGLLTGTTVNPTNYTAPGTFIVNWVYTSPTGSSATQLQTVVISAPTPPVPNVAVLPSFTNACSVTLAAPKATDTCLGQLTGTTSNPTNYTARGTYLVTWIYTGRASTTATQLQTVVIDRSSPPTLQCPGNIVTGNTAGQCGAIVLYNTPVTTPNCSSATLTQLAGLPSGAKFPIGVTTNTFRVTDSETNSVQCSFTVTVLENQLPTLTCPGNISASTATGQCVSAPITYPVTALDNCPGVSLTYNPTNGSTFAVGSNTVIATAIDTTGNTNTCSFKVIIKDLVGPQITCSADIVTNALTSGGTVVTFPAVTATDSCSSASVLVTPPSGTLFPAGSTPVTVTAFDLAGNQTLCRFNITVRTPLGLMEGAYIDAQALAINVIGVSNIKQYDKGLASLLAALGDNQWQGELHLNPSSGKKALSSARKAAQTFVKLSKRTDTGVSAGQWLAVANKISDSARSVAAIAISDAVKAGGDAKQIASANQSLASGDAAAASGAPDKAIQEYTKAWQGGIKAQP
ncbi:MAG: HYR domain-containing protein [Verrucomicrobiota bacterium]